MNVAVEPGAGYRLVDWSVPDWTSLMFHHAPSRSFDHAICSLRLTLVAMWSCFSLSAAWAKAPLQPVNVVLVHGIYDTGTIFKLLARMLEERGY